MQTTLDLFRKSITGRVESSPKIMEEKTYAKSRLGCEECKWFGYSFLKLPCGNCIQDFYFNHKHTLELDEMLTLGFLLKKKNIKDLSTAHYVWDKTPAKPCINPLDNKPLCNRCLNEFCSTRVTDSPSILEIPQKDLIVKIDCGTCLLLNSDWKKDPCKSCDGTDHHKPNWKVIQEQNQKLNEYKAKFCLGWEYDYDTWDCGWLSCSNCKSYRIDDNSIESCAKNLVMPNEEETPHYDWSTSIYDNCCFLVTPENQAQCHKQLERNLGKRKRNQKK